MDSIFLTNIQRFSLHDGPGIRTTVFLKGCSLRCPWCSNPENILPSPQAYIKDGKQGIYGKYYNADDLVKECLKDKAFYSGEFNAPRYWLIKHADEIIKLPGGVTFSGGEALLQMEQLVPVCESLHYNGIHIAMETSLFAPSHSIHIALNHIDFFYVDMKILNSNKVRDIESGNLDVYYANLYTLMKSKLPIVIRIPVIGTYTDGVENRIAVKELLTQYKERTLKIELIKEHNLGENKYQSLGLDMVYHGVSDELMNKYKTELLDLNIPIEICKV